MSRSQTNASRTRGTALKQLRLAFDDGRLALFLGAGTSVGSGVPTWDHLVTSLYINGIVRRLGRYARVPGLVSSVGRWAFRRQVVPLEVAARGLRTYYINDAEFLLMMRTMLYGLTGLQQWSRPRAADVRRLLLRNTTLRAVAQLCRRSVPDKRGVRWVITYNYDDLLEQILGRHPHQSVWSADRTKPARLPIYHVHGFVPLKDGKGSQLDEIVLSEDQYHQAAQNPYSWNNLVQMRALSECVGLMIGLSLTDRNLRRILDNLRAMPSRSQSFALMKRPTPWTVEEADLTSILDYMKERVRTGFEIGYDEEAIAALDNPSIRNPITRMIRDVQVLDWRREEETLAELGVTVVWYETHDEVADILVQVTESSRRPRGRRR